MSRTHDDEWDLASSVGATATMVAAGRAMATKDPRGLIDDPFAEPLVRAVGIELFVKMMDGDFDVEAVEDFPRNAARRSSTGWPCAHGFSTTTSSTRPAPAFARR